MKAVLSLSFLGLAAACAGPQSLTIHDVPQEVANVRFEAEDGTRMDLADFHGEVVLLTVWATWCNPSAAEMRSLEALSSALGNPPFQVIPLWLGAEPAEVREFYDAAKITEVGIYVDRTMLSEAALRTSGLPASLLIGRDGSEIWRQVGSAGWDDPETIMSLRETLE